MYLEQNIYVKSFQLLLFITLYKWFFDKYKILSYQDVLLAFLTGGQF